MIESVIIFGGHIQALGLARQAKSEGMKVYLIVPDRWSVAKHSNTVDRTYICRSDEEILGTLENFKDRNALLFPTGDDYVEFLSKHYSILSRSFIVGIPSQKCIESFSNKRNTYKFCEDNNIPHPSSKYPESLEDVISISSQIDYPTVVKPAVMYSFHKLTGKKAFLCKSKEELILTCSGIERKGYPISNLVIQEFLSGGAATLYSYGVYAKNGKPKAWIQANRIRQNPMDFGNSTTFALTCNIPEIEESAKRILELTDYSGLAEVEFMYDKKSNQYKFLEINTRAWKWHSISENFGFGFMSEMIRDLNNLPSQFHDSVDNKAWVERLTDFTIIFKELLKGKLNLAFAIRSYRCSKNSAVWSIKDPLPTCSYLLMSLILFIKRY